MTGNGHASFIGVATAELGQNDKVLVSLDLLLEIRFCLFPLLFLLSHCPWPSRPGIADACSRGRERSTQSL